MRSHERQLKSEGWVMWGATQGALSCKCWDLSQRPGVVRVPGQTIPGMVQCNWVESLQPLPYQDNSSVFQGLPLSMQSEQKLSKANIYTNYKNVKIGIWDLDSSCIISICNPASCWDIVQISKNFYVQTNGLNFISFISAIMSHFEFSKTYPSFWWEKLKFICPLYLNHIETISTFCKLAQLLSFYILTL